MRPCACGCGAPVKREWVKGHHWAARQFDKYRVQDRGHDTPCWVWTGSIERTGYGRMTFRGQRWRVHRAFYTLHVGAIPDGLTLDHLCRVKACCNPAHLEPVTFQENSRRERRHQIATGTGPRAKVLEMQP